MIDIIISFISSVITFIIFAFIFMQISRNQKTLKKEEIHKKKNYTHYDFMVEWLESAKKQRRYYSNERPSTFSRNVISSNLIWTEVIVNRTSINSSILYKNNSNVVSTGVSYLALLNEYTIFSDPNHINLLTYIYYCIADVKIESFTLNEDTNIPMEFVGHEVEKPVSFNKMIEKLEFILANDKIVEKVLKKSIISRTKIKTF